MALRKRADARTRSLLLERVQEERWTGEHARVELWSFHGAKHQLRTPRFELGSLLEFLDWP